MFLWSPGRTELQVTNWLVRKLRSMVNSWMLWHVENSHSQGESVGCNQAGRCSLMSIVQFHTRIIRLLESRSKNIRMKRIQIIVIAWIACLNVVCGQEYGLEVLTASRAVRLVAESEEGATNLILPNVSSIDVKTAKELAKAPQSGLLLDGLSSIDEGTAHELAKFSGFVLALNGLTFIGPGVAQELSTFKGRALVLNGVTTIEKKPASDLAEFSGQALFLDGLTSMDTGVAGELAAFQGKCLGLYGVGTIDEEVMRVLMQWRGEKLSVRQEGLTTKARVIMDKHKRSWEIIGDVWASF
jgi:hypothetical protein